MPVKDVPVPALTLLKQQISATPPGAIVAASVVWHWIQMFLLNSTHTGVFFLKMLSKSVHNFFLDILHSDTKT